MRRQSRVTGSAYAPNRSANASRSPPATRATSASGSPRSIAAPPASAKATLGGILPGSTSEGGAFLPGRRPRLRDRELEPRAGLDRGVWLEVVRHCDLRGAPDR